MRLAGVVLYTRRLSRILGTSSRGGYTILSPSLDAKVARITSYQSGSINSTANWRLAFFLAGHNSMQVHLVDDDQFEITNYRAQLLLGENFKPWLDKPKVEFLAERCSRWGWDVTKERTRITWGWKNPLGPHCVAFLGFDNMEARRVGVEAGFAWLVECGVGTDFSKPHVSWHSLPPDRRVAKELFVESAPSTAITSLDSDFLRRLDETPGGRGRVTFENIQAAAPCLGALAAAFAWMEMLNYSAGQLQTISGGLMLGAYCNPSKGTLLWRQTLCHTAYRAD